MPCVLADIQLFCQRCGARSEVQGYADGVLDPLERARRFIAVHRQHVLHESAGDGQPAVAETPA